MTFIVFQDTFSGFKHISELNSDTLEQTLIKIEQYPKQCFMFHIYKSHENNVPLLGTRFDTYKRVRTVTGNKCEKMYFDSHEYALTHSSSMAWFFTDDMFGDS